MYPAVKGRLTLSRFVAALAWLGLVLAPVAMPVSAMAMAAAQLESMAADMPEAMPCCPETQKKPDCAKDCQCVALCAGSLLPLVASGTAAAAHLGQHAVIAPHNDAERHGWAQGPPARPPKP
jgi:hypothetical protein